MEIVYSKIQSEVSHSQPAKTKDDLSLVRKPMSQDQKYSEKPVPYKYEMPLLARSFSALSNRPKIVRAGSGQFRSSP